MCNNNKTPTEILVASNSIQDFHVLFHINCTDVNRKLTILSYLKNILSLILMENKELRKIQTYRVFTNCTEETSH